MADIETTPVGGALGTLGRRHVRLHVKVETSGDVHTFPVAVAHVAWALVNIGAQLTGAAHLALAADGRSVTITTNAGSHGYLHYWY